MAIINPIFENLVVKKLVPGESDYFFQLLELFKEVFEETRNIPPPSYLEKLLVNNDFLVFVALSENKILGGLTIYCLPQYFSEKPLAYIYDLAVLPAYQGNGIGQSLISSVIDYCGKNNFEAIYVEAEAEDIEAIRFYRKTALQEEKHAIHFTFDY